MLSARASPQPAFAASALGVSLSIAVGWAISLDSRVGMLLLGSAVVVAVAWLFPLRYVVVAFLIYLPLEGLVLTHVPGPHLAVARYAPELALYALAVLKGAPAAERIWPRVRPIGVAFTTVVLVWAATVPATGVALSSALIGFRSELRYLPLLVLALASVTARQDALWYGRVLVAAGVAEACLIALQFAGLGRARELFAPDYVIQIDGVTVAASSVPVGTAAGTFSNHNAAGIFLVIAFVILLAAGATGLRTSRSTSLIAGALIVSGIVLTGSRESAIACLVAGGAISLLRFRRRTLALATGAAAGALAAALLWQPTDTAPSVSRSSTNLVERWHALLSPTAWSASYTTNFRLYYLASNTELVVREAPAFGYGIGSVTDRRKLEAGDTPLSETAAGQRAMAFSYLYDGNWNLLLLEVGLLGVVALAAFLFALGRLGIATASVNWTGTAVVGLVAAIAVLGFFAPILQLRPPNAALWLFVGLAAALRTDGRRDAATGPKLLQTSP